MTMSTTESMLRPDALQGRVIVITGGGTGLGLSMARTFLALGARVAICGRKAGVLEQAAADLLQATAGEVLAVPCDVRRHQEVDALLERTLDRFGRVDALVNNAAGNFISPTERLSPKAFEVIIDIVLMGTVNCLNYARQHDAAGPASPPTAQPAFFAAAFFAAGRAARGSNSKPTLPSLASYAR